jgi:hypothetical protein
MKKSKLKKENNKDNQESFSEVFDLEKEGKEKTIVVESTEEHKESKPSKEQLKKQKKVLIGVFITMFCLIAMLVIFYSLVRYSKTIDYKGVKFEQVKEGNLMLYQTAIPYLYKGKIVPYNFYLRKDPRTQEKIEFNDTGIGLRKILVINGSSKDINCAGDGVIAVANLVKLYEVMGAKVIKDENATCDNESRYDYVNIVKGNKTRVISYGDNQDCFTIEVKDCEVLMGVEKFMLESFVEFNKEE